MNETSFISIENTPIDEIIKKSRIIRRGYAQKKVILFTTPEIEKMFQADLLKIKSIFSNLTLFFVEDSSYDIAVEAARKVLFEDFDVIIGFGGGKVLDTAKYVSFISKKTYFCIPTLLSNDGLASPIAVLKTSNGRARSFGAKSPDGVLVSTLLVKMAPSKMIRAGIGDTLSNFSALFDWKLDCEKNSNEINDYAYLLSDTALNIMLYSQEKDIFSVTFLRQLAESLLLSGFAMNIAGNSRPCSGSEHLFSHSLDEHFDIVAPHGIKVALGTLCSCFFQERDPRFVLDFISKYQIEINPLKLGISKEMFVRAWQLAPKTRPDRYTILNEINLSSDYLESIYSKIMEDTI